MDNLTIPQNPTEEAAALGFPAALFGFTPEQRAYWHEPGLPWLTAAQVNAPLLDARGLPTVPTYFDIRSQNMAPRFPAGAVVVGLPVFSRRQLAVGKVYAYGYTDAETGQRCHQLGRLEVIGDNYLQARADNRADLGLIWLLREVPGEELWDVREITHYVTYPAL